MGDDRLDHRVDDRLIATAIVELLLEPNTKVIDQLRDVFRVGASVGSDNTWVGSELAGNRVKVLTESMANAFVESLQERDVDFLGKPTEP